MLAPTPARLLHQTLRELIYWEDLTAADAAVALGTVRRQPSFFDAQDAFGDALALSDDGDTLAVGAWLEDGGSAGINDDESDDSLDGAGAVFVFVRSGNAWEQQAYIKPTVPAAQAYFGWRVALSENGDILAVTARDEAGQQGVVAV